MTIDKRGDRMNIWLLRYKYGIYRIYYGVLGWPLACAGHSLVKYVIK
jgi:hypothetical protein